MPSIHIVRRHARPMAEAKKAVDKVARAMAERFDVEHAWEGDTLQFERSGASGHIAVVKGRVEVVADLSFLLLALKPAIEREIERQLDETLGKA